MNDSFWPLILVGLVLLLAAAIGFGLWVRDRRRLQKLTSQVDQFLQTGKQLHYSLSDDAFAPLQNAICDLENRLLLEQSHTVESSRKNAELIADISHQLKTPLAGIRLYCEMAMDEKKNGYQQKQLKLIEKMEKLIYGLLRLEKLRADTYVMHFESQEMRDLLREIVWDLHPLFQQKQIEILGDGVLRCDGVWLSEAIGNLVKNACDHTAPDGHIRIQCEKGTKSVLLQIEDDGGGVPERELPLLFHRFHRTENAAPDSAGLGMAISKTIIEKHHGTITAENGEKGLRVTICLPILDENIKL